MPDNRQGNEPGKPVAAGSNPAGCRPEAGSMAAGSIRTVLPAGWLLDPDGGRLAAGRRFDGRRLEARPLRGPGVEGGRVSGRVCGTEMCGTERTESRRFFGRGRESPSACPPVHVPPGMCTHAAEDSNLDQQKSRSIGRSVGRSIDR